PFRGFPAARAPPPTAVNQGGAAGEGLCPAAARGQDAPLLRQARPARTISTKRSNRCWLSVGPGQPSGWYWTLNTGRERWPRPSTEPSFRLSWLMKKSPSGTDAASTWNSWFWLVMCTEPLSRSLTGWLAPWCPKGSLEV